MEKYIRRDSYLEQLKNRKENGLIKVITGIRRCGKSFLLFELFYQYLLSEGIPEDHIITIALDDDLYTAYRDPAELSKYIRSRIVDREGMFYIFIDEVQYAISREELKDPESIRFLIKNIMIMLAGIKRRLLRHTNCTAVCRWCCFGRKKKTNSSICLPFLRRSISGIL